MSITRLTGQDVANSSTSASVSATYPGATTAGNLLIATAYSNNANAPAISGWTSLTQGINASTAQMGVFYKLADGTETSITASATSATIMKLHLYEYTGNANPISLDVSLSSNNTTVGSTSWATPSITTVDPNDLIFAAVGLNGDLSSPSFSGLNLRQSDSRLIDGDLLPGTIESAFSGTASWTSTLKPSAIIGAFRSSDAQITQYIEMMRNGQNATGTANTYIEVLSISTKLNTADFDGTVSYYFEVDLKNNGTAGQTAYAQLYNNTDAAAISGSELTKVGPNTSGFPLRLRSSAITLSGDKVYTVQLKHSNTTVNTQILAARIIVIQSGSITKTQIHHELGFEASTSSTTNSNILLGVGAFLYEAAKYDGSVSVRHDAVIKSTTSNTTTSGIYDVTGSSVVTSSEVSTTSTSYSLQSSGAITLTDGHVYRPTSYVSAGASVAFESNKLVFTITGGFTKFLAYINVFNSLSTTGQGDNGNVYPAYNALADSYISFNPDDWTGLTLTTYYEANISVNSSGLTASSNLETYVYATSSSNISGSDVTHTGDTLVSRVRSSSFSMPSGANDIITGIATSSGTNTAKEFNNYLIAQVTGMSGSSASTIATSDSTTATDALRGYSDTVATREQVSVQIVSGSSDLSVSVNDQTTVTENNVELLTSFINVNDSSAVTDTPIEMVESYVNKNDSSAITEFTQFLADENVNKSDSSAITENVTSPTMTFRPNVKEFPTLTDTPIVVITTVNDLNVTVNDSSAVTENTPILIPVLFIATVSDSSAITENVPTPTISYQINKNDSSAITDTPTPVISSVSDNNITVFDSSTIIDTPIVFLPFLTESVNDSSAITDIPQLQLDENIVKSDTSSITENVLRMADENIVKSDTTGITENTPILINPLIINVNDPLTLTDSRSVNIPGFSSGISLQESTTITESYALRIIGGFWYNRKNTGFKSDNHHGWEIPKNTSFKSNNQHGWYTKNNSKWEDQS